MKSTKISDYMITNVVSVEPDTDLFKAIGLMLDHNIGSMPVVNKQGEVVGLLSQWDCLKNILSGSYAGNIGGQVHEFMDTELHALSSHDDVVDVAANMTGMGWHQSLPVIDDGELVGTISCRDILEVIYDFDTHQAA